MQSFSDSFFKLPFFLVSSIDNGLLLLLLLLANEKKLAYRDVFTNHCFGKRKFWHVAK